MIFRERTSHLPASLITSKDRHGPVNIHSYWSVMSSKHLPLELSDCSFSEYMTDFNNNNWTNYIIEQLSQSQFYRLLQLLSDYKL